MERRKRGGRLVAWLCLVWGLAAGTPHAVGAVCYPGRRPGPARATVRDGELVLSNEVVECHWTTGQGRLRPLAATSKLSQRTLRLNGSECFRLRLKNQRGLVASDLTIVRGPTTETLEPNPESCRPAERESGRQIRVQLATSDRTIAIQWQAELRDGSNYVRQEISVSTDHSQNAAEEIVLVDLAAPDARPAGMVDGSPALIGDIFVAFEHPLAKTRMLNRATARLRCLLHTRLPFVPGVARSYSSVLGVTPPGQRRRGFLYYLERERAHRYRPFLHYNSWYDVGYGAEKILQSAAIDVVESFGTELIKRRRVTLDSFVWDDGWDDPASLWRFHDDLAEGFGPVQEAAARYGSTVGAWLSPWGGYGRAKQERMKYGKQEGFETNARGFSLASPKYYARFRDVCTGMIRDFELNYFKFDGIGSAGVPAGVPEEFAADVEALLELIGDLRSARADVFVNVTTGTWPSPFWLWHGDSTWRAGADWSTSGWGPQRQRQITYRNNQTYHNVVRRAPLYPLNSLMTQGVMFANHGLPEERAGLVQDIRAFFASGTNCQELYITPSLLDAEAWDALAAAARWSRDNADVLVDTHWIGGDPAKGEVYGWASWSARKGILALRNPKNEPRTITIDVGEVFELPDGAAREYALTSPWPQGDARRATTLSAGEGHTFELEPFEVLVFDAAPR